MSRYFFVYLLTYIVFMYTIMQDKQSGVYPDVFNCKEK